ncbi:MAG: hypothetical protein AB1Z19_01020, partial [Eubacteriales bacterium]
MAKKTPKYNLFHANVDEIIASNEFNANDFSGVTAEEKASMTEKHESVSYWKDAARRFKKNHVSMVALYVVIIITLFAFLGPYFVPYSYEEQYRGSIKLGPFENSEGELLTQSLLEEVDAVYATAMAPGSLTALKKGDYFFKYHGKWYTFTLSRT